MDDEQMQEHQAHVHRLSRKFLAAAKGASHDMLIEALTTTLSVAEKCNTKFAQLTFLMKDKND